MGRKCKIIKITFISNYLTPHQIPFSNEMYRLLGKDYYFVATQNMETFRMEQGWQTKETLPYELVVTNGKEALVESFRLSKESDVIITGSAPDSYLTERLKENQNGITFRYGERIYKRGKWRCLSPRGIYRTISTYYRYPNRKLYMLCSSAYTAADLSLHGSYLGRCYRWGYFPETTIYNPDELMRKKANDKIQLLWCSRMIPCKHAEALIPLLIRLREDKLDFHLNMIGAGEQETMINEMLQKNHLLNMVTMLGALPSGQVRAHMENANIFLFTSDFEEGWGAVVNEAMNSGCSVVASHAAGCAPFLIQDGVNGFIYQYNQPESLYKKVKALLQDRALCEELGRKAYETIITEWNEKEAARRLLLLIEDLNQTGSSTRFQSGPCSKAKIIWNHWYKEPK